MGDDHRDGGEQSDGRKRISAAIEQRSQRPTNRLVAHSRGGPISSGQRKRPGSRSRLGLLSCGRASPGAGWPYGVTRGWRSVVTSIVGSLCAGDRDARDDPLLRAADDAARVISRRTAQSAFWSQAINRPNCQLSANIRTPSVPVVDDDPSRLRVRPSACAQSTAYVHAINMIEGRDSRGGESHICGQKHLT